MRIRAAWLWALAVTGGVAASCGTQHGNEPPRSPVGIRPAPPATANDAALPPRSEAGGSGRFQCGKGTCLAGEESCCGRGDEAYCRRNAPPDPPTSSQLLANQIVACQKSPSDQAPDEIARCRSSSHCPSGELCCDEFLFSGASAIICKPALANEVACDYGEVCTPGLPCRSPGSLCVQGTCRPKPEVACGKVSCDLRTHSCVVTDPNQGTLECKPAAEVKAMASVGPVFTAACMTHADCLPGELCRTSLGRTYCQRADDGMNAMVCDTVADCSALHCGQVSAPNTKPDCVREPDFWHTICDCR